MKRLIVNADDFGFTRDVNEGIIEAHRHGILTACTLMANGDAFDHAVGLARETSSLDVGCHLVFVQGRSVMDPSRRLPSDLKSLFSALMRREIPLYDEAAAQIRKLTAAGIHPTHIDTHKHTHLLPQVLDAVSRVAREFGIPWVRWPFDFRGGYRSRLKKRMVGAGIGLRRRRFRTLLAGLKKTDHFTGYQLTGFMNEETLAATLKALPEGTTELMCHPARCGAELQKASTQLKEARELELSALVSPAIRLLLEKENIALVNYSMAQAI